MSKTKQYVLTLKELITGNKPVYCEMKLFGFINNKLAISEDSDEQIIILNDENGMRYSFDTHEYNKSWRCWNNIPTHNTNWII